MTESTFYYHTALAARNMRAEEGATSYPDLLKACADAFTAGTAVAHSEKPTMTEEEDLQIKLLRVAAVAMRLATKDKDVYEGIKKSDSPERHALAHHGDLWAER